MGQMYDEAVDAIANEERQEELEREMMKARQEDQDELRRRFAELEKRAEVE